MATFQTVKGFRDFLPEGCSFRNYIFSKWRGVARAYGFLEYEGPVIEPTDLYKKKSGDEITSQLFCFETKGAEDVTLRPEVTPTLARYAAVHHGQFPKPLKWFEIGSCFRYEKPQRGRTREFIQFNVDIVGENSASADAELVAFAIDTMRTFGFESEDFVIRLSDRRLWTEYVQRAGISEENVSVFLQIIDKLERTPKDVSEKKLQEIGSSLQAIEDFIATINEESPIFQELKENLSARGLWSYVKIDPSIVRGLAYYTGAVFEVFDIKHNLRAIAGGGRYDNLIGLLSDGKEDLPACGFAMGDVVLAELIQRHEKAKQQADAAVKSDQAMDLYLIVADDSKKAESLKLLQALRSAGFRTDYGFKSAKVGKQFQAAERVNARFAVVVGQEYPVLNVKNLKTRDQMEVPVADVLEKLQELLSSEDHLPRLA